MIKISLSTNNATGYRWFASERTFVKGYLFTKEGLLYKDESLHAYFEQTAGKDDFIEKVCSATGLFSVLIHEENHLLAAVDVVRAFPLFYCQSRGDFCISDTPGMLLNKITETSLKKKSILQLEAIGYVLGRDTLLNDVYQIQAGEAVFFDKEGFSRQFYMNNHLLRRQSSDKGKELLRTEFHQMLSLLSKRLIQLLDSRPVALPLSGGYDSRLLACLLKKEGYENVTCFTYGSSGTPEKENACKTAEALGYKWIFINHSDYLNEDVFGSQQFDEWVDFSALYSSFPEIQEYVAARTLKAKNLIPNDAVIIPGHTADVTAGGHLLPGTERLTNIPILARYASLKNVNLKQLKKEERKSLDKDIVQTMCYYNASGTIDYRLYELWQTKERQTKQIVNSSKIWDFFGYQYVLPFWDELFVSFFASLPHLYKVNKNFYDEAVKALFSENNLPAAHNQKTTQLTVWKQRIKLWLMKFFLLRPLLDRKILWKNDFSCYRHVTKNIVAELKQAGSYKHILRFNGILSAWYFLYIRRKLPRLKSIQQIKE